MAEEQKYYYLRLKEDFFQSETMVVLETMQDGYLYSNILLKLYLLSLKNGGELILRECIPYNAKMIAAVTHHSVGTVEKCLQVLLELNLIELLDDGTIYMMDIQNFIGTSSTEADRKREYRSRIASHKERIGHLSKQAEDNCLDKCPDNHPTEINSLEINSILDYNTPPIPPSSDSQDTKRTSKASKNDSKVNPVLNEAFETFWQSYPKRRRVEKQKCRKAYENAIKNDSTLTPEKILSALDAQKKSYDWTKDNGQYIPAPLRWLNNARWEDDVYTGRPPLHSGGSPGKSGGGEYIITQQDRENSL